MITTTDALSLVGAPQAAHVAGRWSAGTSGTPLAVSDPATETTLCELELASAAQVDAAVAAARDAFDAGPWPRRSPVQRSAALHGLADQFEREADRFAQLLVHEIGAPVSGVRGGQVDSAIELLRWFADAAATGPAGGWELTLGLHHAPRRSASVLRHEPAGVVAGLTAYNFPLLLLVRKLGGALAAGCTIVLMPSPRAPLSTIAFMRLLERTDIPTGAANLVVGAADAGARLTSSPGVDMVTFTGSAAVGRAVMRQAADTTKRVVLELGGKSPNLLLPGADVEAAVGPSLLRFSLNAGQACGATTRTFVPRADYDRYVAAARAFLDEQLVVGDPRDPATDVGPLIGADQLAFVAGHVERALAAGGRVEAGGRRERARGWYFDPLLIGGVGNDAEISREELFGPVGVVIPYDTVEEAIALAGDNRYALNANVWGPTEEALAVARRLRSGNVTVNGGGGLRPDAPWGGLGESGIGRDGGEAGLREFLELKHVQWPV